jgi:hypothetical protein
VKVKKKEITKNAKNKNITQCVRKEQQANSKKADHKHTESRAHITRNKREKE